MYAKQPVVSTKADFSFTLPTLIEFGYGKAEQLGERLSQRGVKHVFLVTDQGVLSAGLLGGILKSMADSGLMCDVYIDVEPDPSLETIQRGADAFQKRPYDCIVAVGGGSPIDVAKGIRVVVANGGTIGEYAGVGKVPQASPIDLVAVPTTSGTGSEVTIFGVYSDWQNNLKITVTSPHMAATLAVVDPQLTMSLPQKLTAATGIDALAHGIETFFSVGGSVASDALALQAISLVHTHLQQAVEKGDDQEARIGLAKGSLLAGMAFNNGYLGLTHAIGSALSGHCHVPHGVAIGLLLPHVIEYNAEAVPEKAATIASLLGATGELDARLAELAAPVVAQLVERIGLPTTLREVGVTEFQLEAIAEDSFKSGMMKFNPRRPGVSDVLDLLKRAF